MTPNDDFDPEAFLNSTVSGSFSTQRIQCPEGTYRAQLEDISRENFRQVNGKDGRVMTIFSPRWNILDDAVRAELEREKVIVEQTIWLDFDENGALDTGKGKNVDLGLLRTAVGQNDVEDWSFPMLSGQMANVQVKHRKQNDDTMRAQITRVSSAD